MKGYARSLGYSSDPEDNTCLDPHCMCISISFAKLDSGASIGKKWSTSSCILLLQETEADSR